LSTVSIKLFSADISCPILPNPADAYATARELASIRSAELVAGGNDGVSSFETRWISEARGLWEETMEGGDGVPSPLGHLDVAVCGYWEKK
jgi:hypothetical protein